MIYLGLSDTEIYLPRIDRCKGDCCNLYQLIFQNLATKDVTVFKLRDYSQGNPSFYRFSIVVPEYLKTGEYKIFLVSAAEWCRDEIDVNAPQRTERVTDKEAITANDAYLVFNGKLLVTGYFRAEVIDASGEVTSDGQHIHVRGKSQDERPCGEISKSVDVIHTDLLTIYAVEIDQPERYVEPKASEARKKYIEHERYQ